MSVTFSFVGAGDDHFVNVSNVNARDILDHLALSVGDELWGEVDVEDLIRRCQARLNEVHVIAGAPITVPARDPKKPLRQSGGPGTDQCRVLHCGRPAGYLREKTERLLWLACVAEMRGVKTIHWS